MPDVEAMAQRGECQIVTFDTEPGDVTIHHARTIHGAGPNTSQAVHDGQSVCATAATTSCT